MGRRITRTSSQDLKKILLSPTGGKFMRPIDGFDEVYPGILLGDAETALSTCLLKELKVTHVLNAAYGKNDEFYGGFVNTSFSNYDAAGIKFMGITALDSPSFYLRSYFKDAANFIDDAIKSKGKVLIHCQCGISRSATLIAAFLMIKKGMDAQTALSTIRESRSIFPNQGFLSQICDFEYELKQSGKMPDCRPEGNIVRSIDKPLKDPAANSAFHTDARPMFSQTNYWPFTRRVSKKGYPVSSAWWDYETESRSRARSEERFPSIYDWTESSTPATPYRTIRSTSVLPDALYYQDGERPPRSSSVRPKEAISSSPAVLSSYDIIPRAPETSYTFPRTSPEPFYSTPRGVWTKPRYYEPSASRYTDYLDDEYCPYLSPYHTRYYSRYYSPLSDSYDYRYRSPYLDYALSSPSYTPLSLRYPYSSALSSYIYA